MRGQLGRLLRVAGVLTLAFALPVTASHIQEPTAPMTGLTLELYEFGNPANKLTKCDNTEVWPFDRIEVKARVYAEALPSEHWTMRVYVYEPSDNPNAPGGREVQWVSRTAHQNLGPHQLTAATSFTQHGLKRQSGNWLVQVGVDGDESGLTFVQTCRFKS